MNVVRRAFLLGRAAPQPLRAVLGDACLAHRSVTCRSCGEHCDAGAITFSLQPGGIALPRLDTDACTGCGDCVPACPGGAIAMIPYLPTQGTRA